MKNILFFATKGFLIVFNHLLLKAGVLFLLLHRWRTMETEMHEQTFSPWNWRERTTLH